MSQTELLTEAIDALEKSGVGYLVTGSLASSLQGEPRATHDVDIVVEVDAAVIRALAWAFGADSYYFDELAAAEAIDRRGMFNLIDTRSGDKIDFWFLTESDFDQSRFGRRVRATALGLQFFVSSPEDTILQKLKWASECGRSERHLRDAAGVYEVQKGRLDEGYLDRWADALGVRDELASARLSG